MRRHTKPSGGLSSLLTVLVGVLLTGCANRGANPQTNGVLFFVPGVAGDGGGYDGLIRGLRKGGVSAHIEVVGWGAPGPLFVMNFQDEGIHRGAEEKLAKLMTDWRAAHSGGRIDVIAHSAGCGVTLGALRRAGTPAARTVVLLNPSVSPGYPIGEAAANVTGVMHVFHSDRDTFFLAWRTSTFGTYDNVKTKAAGNVGFEVAESLKGKVVQHAREESWAEEGNDGSHFGTLAEEFAEQTIAPVLQAGSNE